MSRAITAPATDKPFVDEEGNLTDQSRPWTQDITTQQFLFTRTGGSPDGVVEARMGRIYRDDANTSAGGDLWYKRVDAIEGDKSLGWFLVSGRDGSGDLNVEVGGDYLVVPGNAIIYVTASATITLPDPRTVQNTITIRDIAGVTTINSVAGTVETSSLTFGQAVTHGPRESGWFSL